MSISNSAFSKGRAKILHTAFIELNQIAIVGVTYSNKESHKRYRGFRLLAVDGSKVRLPNEEEIKEEFGVYNFRNHLEKVRGENAFALASVLYDVENQIALDSVIAPMKKSEKDLAISHLKYIQKNDLLIFDRGYGSYELMSKIIENKGDFVIRLSSRTFKEANLMFEKDELQDLTVVLKPNVNLARKKQGELKKQLKVRFVKVILSTGEVEILATSLLDEEKYPQDLFKEIYWKRWKVETFYSKLKTRLELENFTGLSVESIKQDFYSSVFLTGLESVLTEDIDEKLEEKETKHKQRVNKAVSFNLVKDRAFDILLEQGDVENIVLELEVLFSTNPTLYRPEKKKPRTKTVPRRLIDFLKRRKKYVF